MERGEEYQHINALHEMVQAQTRARDAYDPQYNGSGDYVAVPNSFAEQMKFNTQYVKRSYHNMPLAYFMTWINQLMQDGLIQVSVAALVILFSVSGITTYLFRLTSVTDVLQNRNITGVFEVFNIIIAFFYRDSIKESTTDYKEKPAKYSAALLKIQRIAQAVSASIINSANNYKGSQSERRQYIENIFRMLSVLNQLMLRIFDRKERKIVFNVDAPFVRFAAKHGVGIDKPHIFIDVVIFEIQRMCGELGAKKIFSSSQEAAVLHHIDGLQDIKDVMITVTRVKAPPIFKIVLYTVFVLFVITIMPLQFYARVDVLTPLLYPFVSYLFSIILIYRYYYGTPFDRTSHFSAMDFEEWRRESEAHITLFKMRALEACDESIDPE